MFSCMQNTNGDKLHQNLKGAKGAAAVPSVQLDDRQESRALSLSH